MPRGNDAGNWAACATTARAISTYLSTVAFLTDVTVSCAATTPLDQGQTESYFIQVQSPDIFDSKAKWVIAADSLWAAINSLHIIACAWTR